MKRRIHKLGKRVMQFGIVKGLAVQQGWIVDEWNGQEWIYLCQVHPDDAVKLAGTDCE